MEGRSVDQASRLQLPQMTDFTEPQNTPSSIRLWISQEFLDRCIAQATSKYPLETGGTFMGWWSDPSTAVVTELIGPGPGADHGRSHFQPDQSWQLQKIANHYKRSERRETYIGDWHTHPDASYGEPSRTDLNVLRRIIHTPAARCHAPLMALFWGNASQWKYNGWQATIVRRRFLWDRLKLSRLEFHVY